jgi:heme-degrading monooxygenase HmoA
MYSASFIFDKKQYDEEFYKLDNAIAEIAKQSIGYLGEEAWENPETGRISNVYYWETMDGLQELINHPKHLEAKAAQSKWLNGYQVVISQVIRAYGDDAFPHPASTFTNG